jgi:hypothetical protein
VKDTPFPTSWPSGTDAGHRRWDAAGPAAIAAALSSPNHNDLVADNRRSTLLADARLNARPRAQEWLVDHARRSKVREKREAWVSRLTLAMVMITAITAIIAATPVMQGWLSTLFAGHSEGASGPATSGVLFRN